MLSFPLKLIIAAIVLMVASAFLSAALVGVMWARHANDLCGEGCPACERERRGRQL